MLQISFVVALLTILSIKNSLYLLFILALSILLFLRDSFSILVRVIKSVFLFNMGITIGYIIISLIKGEEFVSYILYINLKVVTLTYFVFLFFEKVDMIQFFSFSKTLSYLLTITLSQIYSYKKSFEDFRLAYKARVIKKIGDREKGFIKNTFEFFFKRSLRDSKERSLAMKARGFFD